MSEPVSHRPSRRPVGWVVAVVLTLALVVSSAAVAGSVSGLLERSGLRGTASVPTGRDIDARKHLTLKAKLLGGPLVPGAKRPLKVTVANPLSQRVKVTAVTVTPRRPPVAGCKPSWVKVSSFKAGKHKAPLMVKPRRKASVTLKITLKNLPTVNQDVCKGTRFPLKLSASARQG